MSATGVNEPLAVREAPASYVLEAQRVRPGYKQTEVGVIPEDWNQVVLSTITSEIGDGIHTTPVYSPNGEYFFINGNNIRDGRIVVTEDTKVVDYAEFKRHKKNLGNRTILLSINGTIGNLGLFADEAVMLGKSAAYLNVKDEIGKKFVYYYLQTEPAKRQFNDGLTGTTIRNLGLATIRNTQIALPPTRAEQEAIAGALSDADALIEALEQLIAKKRHLKQGAMQELLTGKKRLPGFSGEWEVKRLDAVAEIRSGGTPSTSQPEFWDGDILWCTPTDITALNGFKYLMQTSRTITTQGLKSSSAELIPAHSVVMTSRATIGECAINTVPVATNQGFKNFIPFEATDGEFLYYLLQTKKQAFISLCGGSTFLEIGKTQLAAFEIEVPKEKLEQTAIATTLSDMDTEIAALESRLAKTRALKQGMMHNLLTGKIRLGTRASSPHAAKMAALPVSRA